MTARPSFHDVCACGHIAGVHANYDQTFGVQQPCYDVSSPDPCPCVRFARPT